MTYRVGDPLTWNADDFEPGDRFAIPPQHHKVFTVTDRTERGALVEFKTLLWSEVDQENWEVNLTFFADFALSARQRLRTIKRPCQICREPAETEIDTAYSMVNTVVCGRH